MTPVYLAAQVTLNPLRQTDMKALINLLGRALGRFKILGRSWRITLCKSKRWNDGVACCESNE